MFTPSSSQLSPRSPVYVDNELLDNEEDRIAMIYVTSARLDSIKERWMGANNKKKQYAFVLILEWSDGSSSVVWRSYTDFFEFQCRLLDSFPEEAGSTKGFARIIPYLPGKQIFRKSDLALAEERRPAIDSYIKDLIKLPAKISQSGVVVSFFQRRQSDPELFQQFPPKINTFGAHENSFESRTESNKEVTQEPHNRDELDNEHTSYIYLNSTFEASVSI